MTKNEIRKKAFKMYDIEMEKTSNITRQSFDDTIDIEDYHNAIENFFEIRRYQQKILREKLKEIEND